MSLVTGQGAFKRLVDRFGEKRPLWLGPALIALLTLLAYSSVFSAGFVWDDDDYVTNNPHLRSLSGLWTIWAEPGATMQYYPMVFSLFWLQYQLWATAPFGYHLVNILLHAANALLLWRCAARLGIPGAFWAAFIFALHPVHVESVAWVTELKNVLSATFYFLAFLSYCRFSDPCGDPAAALPGRRRFYALALLFFTLALLSKTVTGSLPAAILVAFWWRQGRIPWRESWRLAPFFLLALLFGLQTASLETDHLLARGPEWAFTPVERALIAGRAVWFYAAKLLWPHPLIFTYPRWQIDGALWWQYLYPAGLLLVAAALWLARRRVGRGPLAALLFFVGTLFPALGFFNFYPMIFSFVADHFQYLASCGAIVAFCAAADKLFRDRSGALHGKEPLVYGAILLLFAGLSWQQGRVYRDRLSLFSDVIAKNPASWMAHNNRGSVYFGRRQYDLAMADFQRALALKPDYAEAYFNRGLLYAADQERDRALADFDTALGLQPERPDFLANRGKLHLDAGRLDLALADYDLALRLAPGFAVGYLVRGIIHGLREEYDRALADINEALRLDPGNADGYSNRGLVYYSQGLPGPAIADFDRALSLEPRAPATHYRRALAHAAVGDPARALADLEQARNLGYALSEKDVQAVRELISGGKQR